MDGAGSLVLGSKLVEAPFGRVMVAKTTHLGDLVISLPLAAALKARDPACTVLYLTRAATAEVAHCCPAIDEVVVMPDDPRALPALLAALRLDVFIAVNNSASLVRAARAAAVPVRVGSLFRLFNWRHCSHLVAITRPWRGLNKRELDLQYLAALDIGVPPVPTIVAWGRLPRPPSAGRRPPSRRHAVVLSPATVTAAAHRWPPEAYAALIERLDPQRFHWFICGLDAERTQLQPLLHSQRHAANVTDLVGKLSIKDFIHLISSSDALVAGNSGPLHLAAALGVRAIGLFQSRRADIRRWQPLGPHAAVIHSEVRCRGEGGKREPPTVCPCMAAIDPAVVAAHLGDWLGPKKGPRSPSL